MSYIGNLLGKSVTGSEFNPTEINRSTTYTSEIQLEFETHDEELRNSEDYKKIITIALNLWETGAIKRAPGYCLSISDMMLKLLHYEGIKSKLVECSLTVISKDPPSLNMIGHDGMTKKSSEEMDSHVVLVTETDIPMIIDLSVSNLLENTNKPFIVERLSPSEISDLSEFEFEKSKWMYQIKTSNRLPSLHQDSILNRINLDKKIESKINFINKVLIFVCIITSLNFIRGIYDFNQKYIIEDNGFGPTPKPLIK